MKGRILPLILVLFLSCAKVYGEGQIYKSSDGSYQIQFPAAPAQEQQLSTDTPAGKVTSRMVFLGSPQGKVLYMATVTAYPNNLEENSKAILDGVVEGIKMKDQLINEQDISSQGHAGKKILYKQHPDWIEVEMRAFVAGNRLYVLTVDNSCKGEDIKSFFDSFQILK